MPITINGSGTVTGITAGGLPDGVITTDDIAASAITRAKMGYAGAILQVVNAAYSTQATNSTTTYSDTGLTAAITPSSSSSKILVLVSQNGIYKSAGNATNAISLKLFRDATEIALAQDALYTSTASQLYIGTISFCYLDAPATTSSTTYKTQFANIIAASTVGVQVTNSTSHITLMEVAA